MLNKDCLIFHSVSPVSISPLTSTPGGVRSPVCVNMDGELRSENLYLPPMLEQRSVVAAVMIALDLKIETVLEGVVVGKLERQ